MQRPFNSFYAGNGSRANAFLPRGFGSVEDRRARVTSAATRRVSSELLAILHDQNDSLPPSEARAANLEILSRPGVAVVATGQQVGLFLGPLYTVYKAASTIAIARALTAETGVRCVPLFWLQTEDHDFDEMAACSVPVDHSTALELRLTETEGCSRWSLADRKLGPEIATLIGDLEPALGELPAAEEVIQLLKAHYREGIAPGRAFAEVLAALFAGDGLVLFDPRCPAAARLAVPVLKKAIVESRAIGAALERRGGELRAAGFAEQIPPRKDTSLAFFHADGAQAARHRLMHQDDGFAVPGKAEALTEKELLAILEADPLRFSTSALLRPMLQDTLFPTAVYVGGPAEVSYFAQLPPVYDIFGLEPPLVTERAHFRLVPHRARNLLTQLGINAADLDRHREELVRQLKPSDSELSPGPKWLAEVEARLDGLGANSPPPALTKAIDRTRDSLRHSMEQLTKRYEAVTLEQDQVLTTRLARLDAWFRPGGHQQERVHSFPAYAARVGLKEFHRVISAAVDPYSSTLREIEL